MYIYLDLFTHCSNYIYSFLKTLNLRSFEMYFDSIFKKNLELSKWKNQCWINWGFFIAILSLKIFSFLYVLLLVIQSLYLLPLFKVIHPKYYKTQINLALLLIPPHLHERRAIIRAVYHVRERRFISTWFKHPISYFFFSSYVREFLFMLRRSKKNT